MSRAPRVLGALCLLANVAFVSGVAVAMARYPGGTWFDPHAPRHDFWRNFLCDLLHHQGLNGQPNPGAAAALGGMVAGIAALGIALWLVPVLSPGPGARTSRWLGSISAASVLAVPLLPSDRFPFLHGAAVVVTGLPTFVAAIAGVHALRKRRALWMVGVTLVAVSALDFSLYISDQFLGGELWALSPALQRVATILFVVFTSWIALASLAARRDDSAADQP